LFLGALSSFGRRLEGFITLDLGAFPRGSDTEETEARAVHGRDSLTCLTVGGGREAGQDEAGGIARRAGHIDRAGQIGRRATADELAAGAGVIAGAAEGSGCRAGLAGFADEDRSDIQMQAGIGRRLQSQGCGCSSDDGKRFHDRYLKLVFSGAKVDCYTLQIRGCSCAPISLLRVGKDAGKSRGQLVPEVMAGIDKLSRICRAERDTTGREGTPGRSPLCQLLDRSPPRFAPCSVASRRSKSIIQPSGESQ